MSALHINSYFPSNAIHYNFLKTVKANRPDIFFIPVYKHFKSLASSYPEIEIDYIYDGLDKKIFITKIIKCLARFFKKKLHLSEFSYLHAHTLISDGIPAYIISLILRKPLVVSVRSTDISMYIKRSVVLKAIASVILRRAKIVYFISPSLQSEIESIFGNSLINKFQYLPNGLDRYWFENLVRPGLEKKATDDTSVSILFVGQIIPRKNLALLIDYVEKFSDRRYILNIVGRNYIGYDFDILNSNLDNGNQINYLGEVKSKAELMHIYRANDLFILLSKKETFGVVFIEALSQGLPIIYPRGQAVDGYFRDGEVGYSCSSESVDELHLSIERSIIELDAMRERIPNRINYYQWDSIVSRYLSQTSGL